MIYLQPTTWTATRKCLWTDKRIRLSQWSSNLASNRNITGVVLFLNCIRDCDRGCNQSSRWPGKDHRAARALLSCVLYLHQHNSSPQGPVSLITQAVNPHTVLASASVSSHAPSPAVWDVNSFNSLKSSLTSRVLFIFLGTLCSPKALQQLWE